MSRYTVSAWICGVEEKRSLIAEAISSVLMTTRPMRDGNTLQNTILLSFYVALKTDDNESIFIRF